MTRLRRGDGALSPDRRAYGVDVILVLLCQRGAAIGVEQPRNPKKESKPEKNYREPDRPVT